MKTLFVNTCVREESRTRKLADHYLAHIEGEIVEISPVKEGLYGLDREKRTRWETVSEKRYGVV